MGKMGSLRPPTTSQLPKAALGARRYRVAVPRSTHKRPGNPGTARGTGSRRTTPPAGPETLAQHRGRDRNTCTRATASEQQTQTARTTRSGSKSWEIRRHHQQRLPHVASNHARAATVLQVSVWSAVEQQAGTQVQIQRHRQMPTVHQTDRRPHRLRLPRPHHEANVHRETQQGRQNSTGRDLQRLEAATSAWQT
jgi:hypothetical protein